MSETLNDEHHDWVKNAFDVDPRAFVPPEEPPAAPAEAAPAEEERTGGIFDTIAGVVSSVGETISSAATTVADTVQEQVIAPVTAAVTQAEQAVVETVTAVGTAIAGAAEEVYTAAKDFIFPPPIPQQRANKQLDALPPEDKAKVQGLLDNAKSEKEKSHITKALASGHTPAELEEFAKTIAGKDEAWMNDNLRLVGDSKGQGIRQQWSFSCAPTTVEAIKGEMDPIYAMKLRKENPDFQSADDTDPTLMNPDMAEDQRKMLEEDGAGGVGTSRDDPDGLGQGLVFKTLLNKQSDSTGLQYDSKKIGKGYTADDAMEAMEKGLADDVPVPITVGDSKSPYAHAALVIATDKGPPRTFTIHDPWYGKTESFTEDQIRNDQVNVGDWHHVGVVFPPSVKK